jgi:hypothetical protein
MHYYIMIALTPLRTGEELGTSRKVSIYFCFTNSTRHIKTKTFMKLGLLLSMHFYCISNENGVIVCKHIIGIARNLRVEIVHLINKHNYLQIYVFWLSHFYHQVFLVFLICHCVVRCYVFIQSVIDRTTSTEYITFYENSMAAIDGKH